ncbi:hypothetical protein D3C85_1512280 [compost metagenome]
MTHHVNSSTECYVFSETACGLPLDENYFEMVMAVFVLHFPFYKTQLDELHKRLKVSGVVIANVYRRSANSRERLIADMECSGFKVLKVQDANNLCVEHEYWILGKQDAQMEICASTLKELIAHQEL